MATKKKAKVTETQAGKPEAEKAATPETKAETKVETKPEAKDATINPFLLLLFAKIRIIVMSGSFDGSILCGKYTPVLILFTIGFRRCSSHLYTTGPMCHRNT